MAVKNVADFGLTFLAFWFVGFGLMFGGTAAGLVGTDRFLADVASAEGAAFFLFQAMFCGTAVTILSGAVAERMQFRGYLVYAVVVGALIYPLVGHWIWGGTLTNVPGWLGDRGFVDFAGTTVVHSVGGWAALGAIWALGARRGRFDADGVPQPVPTSNLPLAAGGGLVLWIGWVGFNGGSALVFDADTPSIVAHTMLSGAAGLVTALFVSRALDGYHAPMAAMNGSLAGLVAVTGSAHAVDAPIALLIGTIGAIFMLAAERALLRAGLDDVVGAVPVHLAAGIWGTLAVGLFADPVRLGTGLDRLGQIQIQVVGIVAAGAFVLPLTLVASRILKGMGWLRVDEETERLGLNMTEHRSPNEALELLDLMSHHARTRRFEQRAHEEPFTWVGQIARGYNRLVDRLEEARLDVKSLRMSEQRLQEKESLLRAQAFHDPMTGLLNRLGFRDAMTDTMAASRRNPGMRFALLFLDFDQFKLINDGMGHEAGDDLLKSIGHRIREFVRGLPAQTSLDHGHSAARLGGDEFALILAPPAGEAQAAEWAEALRAKIAEPVTVADRSISVSVSIGMTMRRPEHEQPADIVRDADTAMYEAKRAGRNCIVTFDPEMRKASETRLVLTQELRAALSDGQFDLLYQPVTDSGSGDIVGFEALIRWEHPERGTVSPLDFIPLAEEIGLIQPIGRWTMRRVIRQLATWQQRFPDDEQPLWVAINLSRRELADGDIVQYLCDLADENEVPRESVHLEITESTMMFDADVSLNTLDRLHESGFPISIDDFGTGYSSLACLHSIPFDTLKIDKAFLSEAATDLSKAAVLEHIVGIAHTFNARVVAEGVETDAHVKLLKNINCDLLQGYYFARPLPLSQAEEMLRRVRGTGRRRAA